MDGTLNIDNVYFENKTRSDNFNLDNLSIIYMQKYNSDTIFLIKYLSGLVSFPTMHLTNVPSIYRVVLVLAYQRHIFLPFSLRGTSIFFSDCLSQAFPVDTVL